MCDIVIIGAGGFGREIQWLIERINESLTHEKTQWNILGYIDDYKEVGKVVNGYKVLGGIEILQKCTKKLACVCAIGASNTRKNILEKIKSNKNLIFPNLIDPSVIKSDFIIKGIGNVICAGSILTVNITIKDFCIINLDCTLGHDSYMGDYVTVYPSVNISGCVVINSGTEIGTGSHVIQGKKIGENTVIGAGAVVIDDIPSNCIAVGIPCKPVKSNLNN